MEKGHDLSFRVHHSDGHTESRASRLGEQVQSEGCCNSPSGGLARWSKVGSRTRKIFIVVNIYSKYTKMKILKSSKRTMNSDLSQTQQGILLSPGVEAPLTFGGHCLTIMGWLICPNLPEFLLPIFLFILPVLDSNTSFYRLSVSTHMVVTVSTAPNLWVQHWENRLVRPRCYYGVQ